MIVALSAILLLVADQLLPAPPLADAQRHHHRLHLHDIDEATNDTKLDGDLFNDSYIPEDHSRCQPLQIPFCRDVDYNKTFMPNFLGHQLQQDAETEIVVYEPLVKLGCSTDIKLFLCTVYAPICFDHDNGSAYKLLPCQSLCESVRRDCAAHMGTKFGREWPQALQCEKFPDGREKGVLCVGNDSHTNIESYDRDSFNAVSRDLGFVCPQNFEVNSYTLYLNGKTYNNCAMPCEDVYLDKSSMQIVRSATGIVAIICLISTIFSSLTFLIDTKRFKYPARPIIIIAFCQLVVATCYLIGFLTHNKVACNDPAEPPKSLPNMKMIRTTTMGNKKGSCTLQFMALYFFQMSTVFWWLMMTISWYMIAKLKWAPEAVSGVARYFHLCSWTIPALLTIYLSVLGDIEGDSLTGTCNVIVSNQESVAAFVIIPTVACLSIGCVFLAIGFKSIWDSREILKQEYGDQTDEHYKLVIRIGLYSSLFIIFSMVFICCHKYEQSNQNAWKLSWLSNICKNRDFSIPCPVRNFSNQGPHYSTFIIKYVASMAIGIMSALFMLSKKTITAYRDVDELCSYKFGA